MAFNIASFGSGSASSNISGGIKLAKKLESKFGKSDTAKLSPSDDIVLSHEVMLACNGEESSEIVRLPNTRCFRYLRKHYAHQCSKCDDSVFHRSSWEMVKPEV